MAVEGASGSVAHPPAGQKEHISAVLPRHIPVHGQGTDLSWRQDDRLMLDNERRACNRCRCIPQDTPLFEGSVEVPWPHPGDGCQGRLHTHLVQHSGHSVVEEVTPAPVEGALLPLRRPARDVDVPEGLRDVSPDLPAGCTSTALRASAHRRGCRRSDTGNPALGSLALHSCKALVKQEE